jgi:predicted metallopeptidase
MAMLKKFKKMTEAGGEEQARFNKIKIHELGKTPERLTGNNYRAHNAKRSILATYEDAESDASAAIVDLLADIRHLCDKVGLDYADHDRVAYNHYTEEKGRS